MKSPITPPHKCIHYNHSETKVTTIEFDIILVLGKKVVKNIAVSSNWRAHYPKNPEIAVNPRGEYGFFEKEIFTTNGDIQQMIKRIFQIVNES